MKYLPSSKDLDFVFTDEQLCIVEIIKQEIELKDLENKIKAEHITDIDHISVNTDDNDKVD